MIAHRIFAALANGMGGLDWPGLPLFVGLYGVQDVEALVDRLLVIKLHRPPTGA